MNTQVGLMDIDLQAERVEGRAALKRPPLLDEWNMNTLLEQNVFHYPLLFHICVPLMPCRKCASILFTGPWKFLYTASIMTLSNMKKCARASVQGKIVLSTEFALIWLCHAGTLVPNSVERQSSCLLTPSHLLACLHTCGRRKAWNDLQQTNQDINWQGIRFQRR